MNNTLNEMTLAKVNKELEKIKGTYDEPFLIIFNGPFMARVNESETLALALGCPWKSAYKAVAYMYEHAQKAAELLSKNRLEEINSEMTGKVKGAAVGFPDSELVEWLEDYYRLDDKEEWERKNEEAIEARIKAEMQKAEAEKKAKKTSKDAKKAPAKTSGKKPSDKPKADEIATDADAEKPDTETVKEPVAEPAAEAEETTSVSEPLDDGAEGEQLTSVDVVTDMADETVPETEPEELPVQPEKNPEVLVNKTVWLRLADMDAYNQACIDTAFMMSNEGSCDVKCQVGSTAYVLASGISLTEANVEEFKERYGENNVLVR